MTEIHSLSTGRLPPIPDDLTVAQFQLDTNDPTRPLRHANIPCLVDDASGRQIYFEELRERTRGLANALSSLYSIEEDDVETTVDYAVAIWAVHRLGGIISPANPDFSRSELEFQLKATKATHLITHPDVFETAVSAAQAIGLSRDRSIVQRGLQMKKAFSERKLKPVPPTLSSLSGTTGTPKGVAIPHIALIANVLQLAAHSRVNENYAEWKDRRYRPGDVAIGVLPLYHIYGLVVNLHFLLYCAMTVVIVPKFNFEGMLKSIVRHKITHLMIVPPQAVLLCKHPAVKKYDLSGIRYVMIGAAPLTDEVNEMLFNLFPEAHIGQGYGMTETCTVITIWSIERKRGMAGGAGQLLPGVVARVRKTDGTFAGYNEIGELVIKAPSNALGYFNNAQATKETFVDGYVRTGDEVKITSDGELWVLDRIKEIMKVSDPTLVDRPFITSSSRSEDSKVAPAELEGTILDHPDISDACVVGIPDEYSGEVPLAFVVLTVDAASRVKRNPSLLQEIRQSVTKHVADQKIKYKHLAGGVEFVENIPKTPSGKLLRRVLRERAKELRKTPKAKL
ncbi:phenylacetyl-CoA ligase [Mycena metata]|uniref:Phenylacetyl-CoA ligase n=1 Tax=Mycena metata TaxID=1033252 RepID=A0AAD7H4X2_9AGAR|nr:phenylacetyl-CoA ligase [Mycena metata]